MKYFMPSHVLHNYIYRSYYTVFRNYMCRTDFHVLLMGNFEHKVMRIEPTTAQRCAQKNIICIAMKNRKREPGRDENILSDTGCYALRVLLNISAVHV